MTGPGARLRALIDKGEHFIAGDCYSALTGKIVESVGFPAAYLGGHACSAFHYAVPDNGIYSQVEQIEQAAQWLGTARRAYPADRRCRHAG